MTQLQETDQYTREVRMCDKGVIIQHTHTHWYKLLLFVKAGDIIDIPHLTCFICSQPLHVQGS